MHLPQVNILSPPNLLMHSVRLLRMLRRRLCISPCVIHCHCSTRHRSSSGNMATIHKSRYCRPKLSQRCSIGDRSGALEGQSRVMTTVHCHIAGMGSTIFLLEEKISGFHQSERSAGHAGEELHMHCVGL